MRRLNLYIGKTVLATSLGALIVLTFLIFISMLVSQLNDMQGDYTLSRALLYVAWRTPQTIYENITFAAFLGCVIGLGVHASANELVIFRAAGVSTLRILWAALRPVLLLTVGGIFWGEYVTPTSLQIAEGIKASTRAQTSALATVDGTWYVEDNSFMYFSGLNRKLYGVTRYRFADDRRTLQTSSFAKAATYYETGWLLEEGKDAHFDVRLDEQGQEQRRVVQIDYALADWNTQLQPAVLNDLVLPTEALSVRSLYRYAQSRDQQGLESKTYWLSFWQKVAQPLVVISLALVGISFIFGSLRETTMGQRLTVAVLVGIVFNLLQQFLASSSLVFSFSPIIAVFAPILVCCLVGGFMLRQR